MVNTEGIVLETTTGQSVSGATGFSHRDSSHPAPEIHQPSFQGEAGEYFRIWIVNMLLSLVTLGIYSAWATVRNRRYLYGNTELDGDCFDFHGKPLAILKGRILAVIFFAVYAFGGDFHPMVPVVALLVLIAVFPWVMVKAMKFRLSNTSWRNLRFGFVASTRQAYMVLAGPLVVVLLVYGLFLWFAMTSVPQDPNELVLNVWLLLLISALLILASFWLVPALHYRLRNLMMNSIQYGDQRFHADIRCMVFLSAYSKTLGIGVVAEDKSQDTHVFNHEKLWAFRFFAPDPTNTSQLKSTVI
jgi:uncharacterized membrane protein YjgN (DUF898 family)